MLRFGETYYVLVAIINGERLDVPRPVYRSKRKAEAALEKFKGLGFNVRIEERAI